MLRRSRIFRLIATLALLAAVFLTGLWVYVYTAWPEISFFMCSGLCAALALPFLVLLILRRGRLRYSPLILAAVLLLNALIYITLRPQTRQMMCSVVDRTPVRALDSAVTGEPIQLCGTLTDCTVVTHDDNAYEACRIADVSDSHAVVTLIHRAIRQSDDPLVQASYDAGLLTNRGTGSIVLVEAFLAHNGQTCANWLPEVSDPSCILMFGIDLPEDMYIAR